MNSYSRNILSTMRQSETTLNVNFFSTENQKNIQNSVKTRVFNKYNIRIDDQSSDDLLVLMRTVYLSNMSMPDHDVSTQIRLMNETVINQATDMVATGVASYFGYLRDVHSNPSPPDIPANTSVYGSVPLPTYSQIGM